MAKLSTITKSVGTLTIGAAVPTAADTVTIGGRVYTWRAAPTTVADEVKIGATLAESAANFAAAINLGAGSGSLYGSGTTANVQVSAANVAATVVFSSLIPGTIGSLIVTTEVGTNTAFGAGTLTGGVGDMHTALAEIIAQDQINSGTLTALFAIDGIVLN